MADDSQRVPVPADEADRLCALKEFDILDTLPEQAFDDLTLLAAHICGTPVALVTLVDEDRQWFKSRVGFELEETPRYQSFCAHAILQPEVFVVEDALNDERFANNPLVTLDPRIRFYAGAPLVTQGGASLGTICVIDREPRGLTPQQVAALRALSRQVMAQLELRRSGLELKRAYEALVAEAEARLQAERVKKRLHEENIYLRQEIQSDHNFGEIVGSSEPLGEVLHRTRQVAPTDTTVLIYGESGTGKELVARAIHNSSLRKDRPMVKVNCAALPSSLIESELFGHERGAFTGAVGRVGRFELANGGTLFLDEIGELPLELQAKLLRVLQEGEFERLGSSRTIKVKVRVIAATNRDLKAAVGAGSFRADLYYRLHVFPIHVPPLRERRGDIPHLVESFVRRESKRLGKNIEAVPRETLEALQNYDWPGNIRELQNVIERAAIVTRGSVLELADPLVARGAQGARPHASPVALPSLSGGGLLTLEEFERRYITDVLEKTGWRIDGRGGAAQLLGLNPSTLRSRLQKLGVRRPEA